MTVLPSVSSLRALRQFAKTARASRPFIGFGDPELDGGTAGGRGVDVASLFTRGAVADVDAVRELTRLPDTADELIALATAQGGGEERWRVLKVSRSVAAASAQSSGRADAAIGYDDQGAV